MAGSRAEIRAHIRSVSKTYKITDAMQLISSVMLVRERESLQRVGDYAREVRRVTRDALASCEDVSHPYLRHGGDGRRYVLYLGSDLGMCGSYNANLTRFLLANVTPDDELHVLGSNQYRSIVAEGYPIANEQVNSADLEQPDLKALADEALARFAAGEIDSVDVLYTRYVNPMTFEPTLMRLLPVAMEGADESVPRYVYLEPDPVELVERLITLMVESSFYAAFVEAKTSEQASRQLAMKTATDNANEMLEHLTLQYNQVRQAEITQEINEIVGGADAKQEES